MNKDIGSDISKKEQIIISIMASDNISNTCKEHGISRATYYRWFKEYLAKGKSGLIQKSRAPKKHPMHLSQPVIDRILDFSVKHPLWGCKRLAEELVKKKIPVSQSCIQNHLRNNNLRAIADRLSKLENLVVHHQYKIKGSAIRNALLKGNPLLFSFLNSDFNSPGALMIYTIRIISKDLELHLLIDSYCSFTIARFIEPYSGKEMEMFYRLSIKKIIEENNIKLNFISYLLPKNKITLRSESLSEHTNEFQIEKKGAIYYKQFIDSIIKKLVKNYEAVLDNQLQISDQIETINSKLTKSWIKDINESIHIPGYSNYSTPASIFIQNRSKHH
jgi:transposase